jgi:uridine phosphorylase
MADKMEFLQKLHDIGARNIEMEAAMFAAFTHRLGIRGTGLCTTLLDRLKGDQVLTPPEELASFDQRAGEVAMAYMNEKLGL